jgi:dihydroorotase
MISEPHNQPDSFHLILKGGHVIDPANGIDRVMDVGIKDHRIAWVAQSIPAQGAAKIIDISGLYVTPGLFDLHTHIYKFRPIDNSYIESVNPDAHLFSSGVTTAVDTGSAGWQHFQDFKEGTIDRSKVRVLAFLNIAREGMVDTNSEQRIEDFDSRLAAAVVLAYPDILVGIKSAHYWTRLPWDDRHPAWASVDRALEAGDLCGKPIMVDFWPRPPERSYQDLILKKLRPGDIHTHVFAQQFPILAANRSVNDFMFQARARGVLFDLGHGAGSFWFRNAVPAFQGEFWPDSISTDLHMGNINGPVISMADTMSKFLNIGMTLAEVIARSTAAPARMIGRPELGTLTPGAEADVAVFDLLEGKYAFVDCGGAKLSGKYKLECRMTVRAGEIVYNPMGLGLPEWEHAPEPYWRIPSLQP